MAKRLGDPDEGGSRLKKRKLDSDEGSKKYAEETNSAQDLQRLLAFRQDAGPHVKQKIHTFKTFLDSIAYGGDTEIKSVKQEILLDYLKSQTSFDDESNPMYLPDVIQTWKFSTQANDEGLFSAVVAVLALLLKTISSLVEFRGYGNLLCKTLLQKEQIKLIDRGLSANRPKEHVVSPCLRLLTEIVLFDGGNAAKTLYLCRDITFKQLDVFLGMRKDPGGIFNDRKPSIRNTALRYLFANLRLQDRVAKTEILAQGRVFRAVLQDIKEDSPDIVQSILDALRKDILEDGAIPRVSKGRVFTDSALRRLATLYSYHEDDRDRERRDSVEKLVHAFLLSLCTTEDYGVLVAQRSGGKGAAKDELGTKEVQATNLTSEIYQSLKPVRNRTLSSFLQSLRPYASVLQTDLALAIFQAAPELIAGYFYKQKSFSFEPKLTATWIGYSMFLMSVIDLPIPRPHLQMATEGPLIVSPSSILIETILPQPLTQKVLTRCLNQSAVLITFLAVKVLVLGFKRLKTTLKTLKSADQQQQDQSKRRGDQAASALIAAFCQRCPDMKHVIAVFRNTPRENVMLREAVTCLLELYYKVIPQVALNNKFDISIALSVALQEQKPEIKGLRGSGMQSLELDHLMSIALRSPDMNWWHRTENMFLSPFTTALRLYVGSHQWNAHNTLRVLLQSIVRERAFLEPDTHVSSLDLLVLSLKESRDWQASDTLYEFLDNCVLRFVKKSVKYYDALTDLSEDVRSSQIHSGGIDLLLIVILEQWPFLIKAATASEATKVAVWLAHYFDLLMGGGRDLTLLSRIRDRLKYKATDKECRAILEKALREPVGLEKCSELLITDRSSYTIQNQDRTPHDLPEKSPSPELSIPPGPPQEDQDHTGLHKWAQKDIQDAIMDGSVEDLFFCFCSKHGEIRKQALSSLSNFMSKLETSGYSEWQQTYVLAGEVHETAKNISPPEILPYFPVAIAAQSLSILANPLHTMYTKINKFLNKGPIWNIEKMPSYWVDRVLLHPPTEDEAHYEEIRWMLEVLINGLRTPNDMEIYRRCHILERVISLSASPSLPEDCNEKIVQLLFRCTYVDGSTTLITRCSLLSWIYFRINTTKTKAHQLKVLQLLASRVYETSDQERVNDWSKGMFVAMLDSLQISENT